MKRYPAILVMLTCAQFFTLQGLCETLTVPAQHPDIFSALENSQPGDTIELAPGIYYESNLQVPEGIALVGMGSTPGDVIIDAQGNGRILTMEGIEFSSSIRSLTFRNGHASGDNSYDQSGGAILCSNSSSEILSCNFITNRADSHGGAIRCTTSSPSIMNCNFSGNSAVSGGGAIDCSYNSHPLLEDCIFTNNSANWGGALSCRGISSPEVIGSTFDENSASGEVAFGGGVFADIQSKPNFSQSTFCANSAVYGGAIVCLVSAETNLYNCTIVDNESSQDFGGVFLFDASPQITGTLVTFNEGSGIDAQGDSQPNISCTDIFGNSLGDWNGTINHLEGINGNISVDPVFCSREPGAENRFFLNESSPTAMGGELCDLMGSKPIGCGRVSGTGPVISPLGIDAVTASPNPFNPRTTINFSIDQSQLVRVSVFNLQGALVRVLANREFPGGAQNVLWNGDDQTGRQIASGAYVVVIQGETDHQTMKIMMLK